MNLTEAAQSGNRRDTLIALRDKLAYAVEVCESGRDTAALSKRLMEVMEEIENLPVQTERVSPLEAAINENR